MEIVRTTMNGLYPAVLDAILSHGALVAPRGLLTRELLGVTLELHDPAAGLLTLPARKLSYAFAVAELLWILLGREDVATIAPYNKAIAKFADDGRTFFGAYGPRLVAQLPQALATLRQDPESRQALVTFWRPSPPSTKDVPCTISLQWFVREGRVHAHTVMRSNDGFLGLPYDLHTFTRLQAYVAAELGLGLGTYRHTVGSLHLYERDWGAAAVVIREPAIAVGPVPAMAALSEGERDALNQALTVLVDEPASVPLARFAEPWRTYLGVLAWKRTGWRGSLRPPFDTLIPDETLWKPEHGFIGDPP